MQAHNSVLVGLVWGKVLSLGDERATNGDKQEIETLVNEEALLLAKFLISERESWKLRIALIKQCLPVLY